MHFHSLGLDHLVGTPALKPYMHGYFLSLKLYDTARIIANPFAYDEHREKLVRDKMEKEAESRIRAKKQPGVKVNKELAEKIYRDEEKAKMRAEKKSKRKTAADLMDVDANAEEDTEPSRPNLLSDPRFAKVFEDPAFTIDQSSREYALLNPSSVANPAQRGRTTVEEEEEESDKASSDGSDSESDDEASDVSSDSSAEGGASFLYLCLYLCLLAHSKLTLTALFISTLQSLPHSILGPTQANGTSAPKRRLHEKKQKGARRGPRRRSTWSLFAQKLVELHRASLATRPQHSANGAPLELRRKLLQDPASRAGMRRRQWRLAGYQRPAPRVEMRMTRGEVRQGRTSRAERELSPSALGWRGAWKKMPISMSRRGKAGHTGERTCAVEVKMFSGRWTDSLLRSCVWHVYVSILSGSIYLFAPNFVSIHSLAFCSFFLLIGFGQLQILLWNHCCETPRST